MNSAFFRRAALLAVFLLPMAPVRPAQAQAGAPSRDSALSIPADQQIQPADLDQMLAGDGKKPLVLQVGSHALFAQTHIAGSEYAGPGSQDAGLKALRDRVTRLPRNTAIVIYCGCCPWERCPNLGPAYKLLKDLGFSNLKALHIANNLGTDWVDKGYPVEHGQ